MGGKATATWWKLRKLRMKLKPAVKKSFFLTVRTPGRAKHDNKALAQVSASAKEILR